MGRGGRGGREAAGVHGIGREVGLKWYVQVHHPGLPCCGLPRSSRRARRPRRHLPHRATPHRYPNRRRRRCPGPTGTSGTTGDTGEPLPTAPVAKASCALDKAHPLLARCSVVLDKEGVVDVVLSATGVPTRTFRPDAVALKHDMLAWGLVPETTYTWTVGSQTGKLTTGALPPTLAQAEIETTGTAFFSEDGVLVPLRCPDTQYMSIIDPEGRIIWYLEHTEFFTSSMAGYEWSQPHRTVLSGNRQRFLEQDIAGNVVLELLAAKDYEGVLHHDTARWKDYRYLLFETAGRQRLGRRHSRVRRRNAYRHLVYGRRLRRRHLGPEPRLGPRQRAERHRGRRVDLIGAQFRRGGEHRRRPRFAHIPGRELARGRGCEQWVARCRLRSRDGGGMECAAQCKPVWR